MHAQHEEEHHDNNLWLIVFLAFSFAGWFDISLQVAEEIMEVEAHLVLMKVPKQLWSKMEKYDLML